MRSNFQVKLISLLAAVAGSLCPAVLVAQDASTKAAKSVPDLALTYNYVHSNAPPGSCGCFSLNGGSANFAWPMKGGAFAVAGDITVATGSNISSAAFDLTLSAYTAGVRFRPPMHLAGLRPFGQVLVGAAHSSGSLVQTANSATSNAAASFAVNLGGGLDLRAGHRLSFRLIEADYLLTTFDNGSNNHQNNVRIDAGVVFRF
jgi:outer membrane immunogenic protein